MTQLIKKIGFLLILAFTTFFSSCEKDLYEEAIVKENYKIKELTFKEAQKNKSFDVSYSKFKDELNTLKLAYRGGDSTTTDLDFKIDSSSIKEIVYGDKISYTMAIKRDVFIPEYFENLVLEINSLNEKQAYIVKYTPSEEMKYNEEHQEFGFDGQITSSKLYGTWTFFTTNPDSGAPDENSPTGGWTNVTCVTVLKCNYNVSNGGSIHYAGPNCTSVFYAIECTPNSYIGSGAFTGSGANNNSTGPNGFSGNSNLNPITSTPIITTPVISITNPPVIDCENNNTITIKNQFYMPLSNSLKMCMHTKSGLYQSIADYLSLHMTEGTFHNITQQVIEPDAFDFVNDIASQMCGSSASFTLLNPNLIDDQITANLESCVFNILNDIKTLQNGKFGEVMRQFIGVNPLPVNYNWHVNSAVLSPDFAAVTIPSGVSITTTMNEYYTEISTDLSVARTLIHEAFHAYLNAVYRNRNIDKDYVTLINLYSTEFGNNLNIIHHHLFAEDKIISHISEALMEYGNLKGYNLTQQYCDDMAWAGLLGTHAYSALPQLQKDRIESTLLSESLNNNQNPQGISPVGTKACP